MVINQISGNRRVSNLLKFLNEDIYNKNMILAKMNNLIRMLYTIETWVNQNFHPQ